MLVAPQLQSKGGLDRDEGSRYQIQATRAQPLLQTREGYITCNLQSSGTSRDTERLCTLLGTWSLTIFPPLSHTWFCLNIKPRMNKAARKSCLHATFRRGVVCNLGSMQLRCRCLYTREDVTRGGNDLKMMCGNVLWMSMQGHGPPKDAREWVRHQRLADWFHQDKNGLTSTVSIRCNKGKSD